MTGYGQNCSVIPYCPRPSGPSSETVLSGTLFISGNSTLDISTIISGLNIVSENLELLLTLPAGFSTNPPLVDPPPPGTPLPATLPLFATGLGLVGLFGWRKRRKVAKALQEEGLRAFSARPDSADRLQVDKIKPTIGFARAFS